MGHCIYSSISASSLLFFMFTVKFVQSNPQIQDGSSDDIFKKHYRENPFPASSSGYFYSDSYRMEYEEARDQQNTGLIVGLFFVGILIVIVTCVLCCCFVPCCCVAKSMNRRRRNREQGQIFLTNGIAAQHPQSQLGTGNTVQAPTATMNQSNYPYGPTLNTINLQPFATGNLQQLPYNSGAPPASAPLNLFHETPWQPPYSPYHHGSNPVAYPGALGDKLPPPYPNK